MSRGGCQSLGEARRAAWGVGAKLVVAALMWVTVRCWRSRPEHPPPDGDSSDDATTSSRLPDQHAHCRGRGAPAEACPHPAPPVQRSAAVDQRNSAISRSGREARPAMPCAASANFEAWVDSHPQGPSCPCSALPPADISVPAHGLEAALGPATPPPASSTHMLDLAPPALLLVASRLAPGAERAALAMTCKALRWHATDSVSMLSVKSRETMRQLAVSRSPFNGVRRLGMTLRNGSLAYVQLLPQQQRSGGADPDDSMQAEGCVGAALKDLSHALSGVSSSSSSGGSYSMAAGASTACLITSWPPEVLLEAAVAAAARTPCATALRLTSLSNALVAAHICSVLPQLQSLELRGCHAPLRNVHSLSNGALCGGVQIQPPLARVLSLSLSYCSLYGCGDLACLAAALPRLQQLRLRSVQLLPQSLSELAPLAPSLTALELLAMHNQHHLELQHVSALTQLRQLVGADLQSEPPYWHGEEEEADPGGQASVLRHQQVLTSALGGLQQLTRLELRRLQGCLYDAAEALMGQLPGSLAELAWRQLALGDGLGDQQLLRSCSAWRCLQQLEVGTFTFDQPWRRPPLPHLTRLVAANAFAAPEGFLCGFAPQLHSLQVGWFGGSGGGSNGHGPAAAAPGPAGLAPSALASLAVMDVGRGGVSASDLRALLLGLTRVSQLDLRQVPKTSKLLQLPRHLCLWSRLAELRLHDLHESFDDAALATLARQHASTLTSLALSCCPGVTWRGVRELRCLAALRALRLERDEQVTLLSVLEALRGCSKLSSLHLEQLSATWRQTGKEPKGLQEDEASVRSHMLENAELSRHCTTPSLWRCGSEEGVHKAAAAAATVKSGNCSAGSSSGQASGDEGDCSKGSDQGSSQSGCDSVSGSDQGSSSGSSGSGSGGGGGTESNDPKPCSSTAPRTRSYRFWVGPGDRHTLVQAAPQLEELVLLHPHHPQAHELCR